MQEHIVTYIDPSDDDFGAVLNCAIRYCLGRQTYMPGLIMDFIEPYIPYLSSRTLDVIVQDIDNAAVYPRGIGDSNIDKPQWVEFRAAVVRELDKRKDAV